MDLDIRRLADEDAELAVDVLTSLKDGGRGAPVANPDGSRAFLQDPRNVLVAALADGEPVGYAIAYVLERADRPSPMILLYEIEVASRHRRRGIGLGLIDRVREIARSEGAYKMWVLTEWENVAARALYRSAGGAESGDSLLIEWSEDCLDG